MRNKVNRVILDTNLWINFLITKDYIKLDKLIFSKECVILFSKELMDEFLGVANRPKFRRFFTMDDLEDVLETIDEYAQFIEVGTRVDACRDVKDNFLLSLSVDGGADYLLTVDNDLLDLKTFGHTKIITLIDFLDSH